MGSLRGWVMSGERYWLPIHFIIFLCFFCSNTDAMSRRSNETDRLALLAFKAKIVEDPFGTMTLWNDTSHFCQWYGVTCSPRHQRVTNLTLVSLKLGGSISPHVGNLSFLHALRLQNNSFVGEIPPEIGRLQRLQVLNLVNNTLGGEIPLNLSSCSNLEILRLSWNQLEGGIPPELGSLSKLQHFRASANNLTGPLPPSLGNLTLLVSMYLGGNNLGGSIPVTLGSLSHLTDLGLYENHLSGTLPSSIFNLTSLHIFDVGSNQLGGNLPSDLFTVLPNLQFFSILINQFTGHIPVSLSNASNLQVLQVGNNSLTGKVPSLERLNKIWSVELDNNLLGSGKGSQDDLSFLCSLTNATRLRNLVIGENKFGGMLPGCVANLSSKIFIFFISGNYISGSIPPAIDNLKSLEVLLFSNNSLTGTIPSTVGNLKNLVYLYLSYNDLSGHIPSSMGKLSQLTRMDLSSNSLEGTIPSSLRNCTSLQMLSLDQNNLIGSIPPQVLTIPSLTILLSISHNQLTGALPEEVGKLTNLNVLDFSYNRLSGQIPNSLGECTSLQLLYLEGNNFKGSIPSSLSSMKGLQALDLSSNNLSGQIPEYLAAFNGLSMLNLSFNDLEGEVPKKGVFTNASATSLKGNNKLCGGIPDYHLPQCSISPRRKRRKLSVKTKVTVATIIGLAAAASLILLLYIFGLRRKQRHSLEELNVATSANPPLQFVSYGDLHRATNGFSEGYLVGTGSFGHVYKGILGEGEETVAIKVLDLKHLGASRSFVAECEALRNIRHRNLVKLVTVCSGVDHQGNDFKALVYEFMPNGSLEDWLHPLATREDEVVHQQRSPRKLSLLKRISIAIDVASLLEYVHHQFGTPLVHCDIKPSNILLDGDLFGHVSDFGLAKFISDTGIIRSSADPLSSVGIRGTVGYAPPEYGLGCEVSTKGDVYSYGILLLEMFTGKRPTDEMFKDGISIHLFAKMALPSGVVDILDPTLLDLFENEDQVLNPRRSLRVVNCLISLIEIGVACSIEPPVERKDMSMVVAKLQKIRDTLFKGNN